MTTDQYVARPWEPPVAGNETQTLLGSLERQRHLFGWKCGGLDAAGLRATLRSSTMTLGGLLNHLALVEDHHFSHLLLAQPPGEPWRSVDWEADPDHEWRTAADLEPQELYARWQRACELSRARVAEAVALSGMDTAGRHVTGSGESPLLRRILVDLIEEYARHLGHADLLRESVDGLVGEDPPNLPA